MSGSDGQDRVAVVTGAGTGIGRAISRGLVAGGWRVVLVGRRRQILDDLAAESALMTALDADLSDPGAVEGLAKEVSSRFGAVDLLVANAGSGDHGPTETVAEVAEHWRRTLERVILPTVLIEHALRPYLRRPGGRVVAITSAAARGGGPVAYGATKAALNRWVITQASLLGEEGITVNALAPGFVPDTELYGGGIDPDWAAKIARGIAVGRPGTPDDIADAVLWLSRPESGFVNGTVVEVDGGRKVI
jgi:3-oxoacyl-[acyl-carrier protein] reductase